MKNDLIEDVRKMFKMDLLPWDEYFMTMAQTDFFMDCHEKKSTKAFFFRQAPFNGSYAIFGGLTCFLRILQDFSFDDNVINELRELNYSNEFLSYLQKKKKLDITIESIAEGSVVFPNEPIVILKGDLLSVRLAEGMLCHEVNFGTLFMTKWHRVVMAASPGRVLEFSKRRAQNPNKNSFYAFLAGCHFTSNSTMKEAFKYILVTGTMGHEFVQSVGDEYTAFDKWLTYNPDKPVLLIDTIDTLKSGLPNAIKAFKKHWEKIKAAGGIPAIRNDSGDLAYLTIEERLELDKNNLHDVHIIQTNDLDEYKIQAIKEQIFTQAPKAGLDPIALLSNVIWACGTMPGTCYDQPSLGGVAKLTSIEISNKMKPVIKLAKDNTLKTSIPGNNYSALITDRNTNELICTLIYRETEEPVSQTAAYSLNDKNKFILLKDFMVQKRQTIVFENEKCISKSYEDIRKIMKFNLDLLHWTHKRFEMPHKVKVSLTNELFDLRQELIERNKLIQDWG